MEKLGGLVLDAFDDLDGAVLKSAFPKASNLPKLVKTAMPVTREQLGRLPDDVFALVLRQGDTSLRKYACVDAGHTALNIAYFLLTHDKLPVEAVKTAAANLITACDWYDIDPPDELKKLSTGNLMTIGRQRVWKDTDGTTYGSDGTSWDLQKTADVVGTPDMPTQFSKEDLAAKKKPASYAKIAEDSDAILEQAFGIKEENIEALPQVKRTLEPHVDVTDKDPPKLLSEKTARYYAMPHERRFPLDGYDHVKLASKYFDEYNKMMSPEDRHTFAVNLVGRASPLGIPVSEEARNYGSTKYASAEHIDICVGQRILLLKPHVDGYNDNVKQASVHATSLYNNLLLNRPLLSPGVFARTLGEIDKLAGLSEYWGQDVVDPFYSTFQKTAESDDTKDAIVVGNEYMSASDLKAFAANKADMIRGKFSEDFLEEFQKDPTGIFDSLPMDQKLIVMRMVNSSQGTSSL